ncbi:hypothetical protein LX99_04197 [Mucilaginibacter oryzae]|uniref:Uncharacterized protein n=1 Tax=Mucilaginibacter oryzae TaxID=468058 RepID=A0A316H2W5_9SPHI|nr:hypothetical protein LX99_04197 [Mucilaginibacter oryzae]
MSHLSVNENKKADHLTDLPFKKFQKQYKAKTYKVCLTCKLCSLLHSKIKK